MSDKKIGVDNNSDGIIDYYTADVITANDYYPFGSQMTGRKYSQANTKYRYGFNGKENDNEVKGEGNQQDYGMRIYDTRLGRFLSVDPLRASYPYYSPYHFAGNTPIQAIDLDGEEPVGYSTSARFSHPMRTWIRKEDDAHVESNISGQWFRMQIKDALGAQWTVFRRETEEIATFGNYHKLVPRVDFYYLDNSLNGPMPGKNFVTNPNGSFDGNLVEFDARERMDRKQGSAIADALQYAALGIAAAPAALPFLTWAGGAPLLGSGSVSSLSLGGVGRGAAGAIGDAAGQLATNGGDFRSLNPFSIGANFLGGVFGLNSFTTEAASSLMAKDNKGNWGINSSRNIATNTLVGGTLGGLVGSKNAPWSAENFSKIFDKKVANAASTIPEFWSSSIENSVPQEEIKSKE